MHGLYVNWINPFFQIISSNYRNYCKWITVWWKIFNEQEREIINNHIKLIVVHWVVHFTCIYFSVSLSISISVGSTSENAVVRANVSAHRRSNSRHEVFSILCLPLNYFRRVSFQNNNFILKRYFIEIRLLFATKS